MITTFEGDHRLCLSSTGLLPDQCGCPKEKEMRKGATMTRNELKNFILETYNATSDFPWVKYPNHEVFRHPENLKWFALMAEVPRHVISSSVPEKERSDDLVTIINIKIDPILSGSLRKEPGFHPAYHMNKDQWITAELGIVDEGKLKTLIDMSFTATGPKTSKTKKGRPYPQNLLSELVEPCLTIRDEDAFKYGKEWLAKAKQKQKAAQNLDRSDAVLADRLLSLIKQPNQDIARKYYKEGMTFAAIAREYKLSSSRIGQQKNKGLRLMLNRWISHGCPLNADEFKEFVRKEEKKITPESTIDALQPSIRLFNTLYRAKRETVADLLAIEDDMKIRNLGPKGWEELRTLQAKARKILQENEKGL